METEALLYLALSRMLREHDELTKYRSRTGEPPALTSECIFLARKALFEFEAKTAK